jgi:CubicO group peptidase (beta-lactamase class C family)
MKHRFVNILLVLILPSITVFSIATSAHAASTPGGITTPEEMESFMDGLISSQMSENHVPGAVMTVVKDGAVFLTKGYGYADLETRTLVDPEHTLFRPGSVSKLFVWTAVMQLVEQGKLNLDTDVNTYLDFTIPTTFREPITLKHLLTHTPGFEDINQDLWALQVKDMYPLGEYLKTKIPARVFAPGKVIAYSNYGAALAAYIVERVSGLSFDAYVEQHIFTPLGIQHSTFRQPLPDKLTANMASGYNFLDGAYQKGDFELIEAYPAGSLSATAADMARFMIAHLQNGRYGEQRILQEATAIQMHQPLFTHNPRLGGMTYGFLESTINGQSMVWHGGDTIFFHSGLFLFPEQNVGLFISTNSPGGESVVAAVMKAFPKRYFPVDDVITPPQSVDFKERIAPYLGEYFSARNNYTTIEKVFLLFDPIRASLSEDGHLVVSMYGEDHQFTEIEAGLLEDQEQPANRMVYHKNDAGQVNLFLTNRPFDYIKSPWYGSIILHQTLLLVILVFFGIALVRWPYGFFKHLRKQETQPVLARLAHQNAGLFGLLLVVLIICFLAVVLNNVPVYEMPRFLFAGGGTLLLSFVLFLPWLLALTAFAMPVFMLMAWVKKFWSLRGRIFYTLLTLCALVGVWVLAYWNFLKI